MTNMFAKYDCCDDDCCCRPICEPDERRILSSDSTVYIVTDLKGNEIGIQVKHNNAFTLYFNLQNLSCCLPTHEILSESTYIFEVISAQHDVIISKELTAEEVFIAGPNQIAINFSSEESKKLDINSYRMRLTMSWIGGSYELYPEEAGLLIVR